MTGQAGIEALLVSALRWQIELGADEAISEAPIDRFAESTPTPAPQTSIPQTPAAQTSDPQAPATGTAPAAPRGTDRADGAAPDARPGPQDTARTMNAPPDRGAQSGTSRQDPQAHPQQGTTAAATTGQTSSPEAPQTRALAAQADSLETLATLMQGWDGSPLKASARSFVFADGLPGARLMVIGEAPGQDEDRAGLPFVGRAGQLLDRMLAAIGLSRQADTPETAAYIINMLPWRPPGNRTPTEQEAALFLPFVERHIQLAKPDLILSMGNTPTKALMATTTGIKRMRGQWTRHSASTLPLMPSFHPAYLLRQPADKRLAWADLLAVRRALDGETPP